MIYYQIILHSYKDNFITDFYENWSVEKTCNSITLESSHPMVPSTTSGYDVRFLYTYECKDNEIAYFKADVNMISHLPWSYLG